MTRVRVRDVRVPMRDGVHLAADVLVPDGGPARPALLMRGPYSRATARAGDDVVGLVRRGWAVVVQDVRGRFDSEGTFDAFHQEAHDGTDTVAWVASQPWCDGRVAGMGNSYLGFTQFAAAAEQPQALRAISPLIVGPEIRDTWIYEGGALQLGLVVPWAASMAATAPDATPQSRQRAADLATDWDETLRTPLARHPLRELFPPFARWLEPADHDYWAPIDLRERTTDLDLPVFQVAGWYDIFCEGTLAHAARRSGAVASRGLASGQRLLVGPWAHSGVFGPGTGEFDFGEIASTTVQGFTEELRDWLQDAVDDKPVTGGIRLFVMGIGEWRDLPAWPPPSTPTPLYLSSRTGANGLYGDGTLTAHPARSPGSDRFRYDPDDPVPSRGGRTLGPFLPLAGPVDQRPVEERDDVLVYTTAPLGHDVTVIGTVRAEIVFETEARSADVTVKLVDVWPDGRAYNVVDSVRRRDFAPGESHRVDVTVGSTAICFRAGHRIRVEVSSSNFPRLDRNPSTGVPLRDAEVLEPAWQTVHHGGPAASHVVLPVVAGSLAP